jgi:hypothetical protein
MQTFPIEEQAAAGSRSPLMGSTALDVVAPLILALQFLAVFFYFDMRLYLPLVLTFVGLVQVFPLGSRFIDNLILFCLP